MANAQQNQNNGLHFSPMIQSSGHLPAADQALNNVFSSLTLSPAPAQSFSPINGNGFLPYGRREGTANNLNETSLQNLRFHLGQMGSGIGPRNPIVGPDVFPMYAPPPPAAALFNNYLNYPSGLLYNDALNSQYSRMLYDFNNLNRKKQMDLYQVYNSQIAQPPVVQNGGGGGGGGSNAYRRANTRVVQPYDFVSLSDMKGGIVAYAMDQHWCRVLQAKFTEPSQEEIEMVLSEVIDCLDELMKNPFGNYLVQSLIAVCNEEQRNRIILSVTKNTFQLVNICCNPHGTRVVQKLMENLSSPQQVSVLMAVISSGAAILAIDQNGHHVIQYCLTHFSTEDNVLLINNLADNCYKVAVDRSGCCVLQICVEKSKGQPRQCLVSEILANAVHLSRDPYGNYVLQHMLGLREADITANLMKQLEGEFMHIACNKYGSNVVEKFLESGEEHSSKIIMELVGDSNAPMILLDPFGNYVIQSALAVSKGVARNALLQLIQDNASSMRSNLYGRKIIACLEKRKHNLM
ncbi:Pumilio isogenyy domain family member 4 [Heracleum sosnowskyi]|uniref:Pumilio isogenyy domain family member 4 n=1 Tax=Heracleum sosnowskyi TaxID=360622 RepID=A0AAD8HHX1_9APIA|nr:Pumilio isogenyy domain family member 4 [Heracleum sosnowskyi]